jgi:hypothetical protein
MKEQDLEQYSMNSTIYKCIGNGFALNSFTSKFYLLTCITSLTLYSYIILNVKNKEARLTLYDDEMSCCRFPMSRRVGVLRLEGHRV